MLYDAAPIWLAAPSRWLANMLPASILARHPVTVIPNGIDTSCYKPLDKSEARRQLGLPEHGLIVGNAAAGGTTEQCLEGRLLCPCRHGGPASGSAGCSFCRPG